MVQMLCQSVWMTELLNNKETGAGPVRVKLDTMACTVRHVSMLIKYLLVPLASWRSYMSQLLLRLTVKVFIAVTVTRNMCALFGRLSNTERKGALMFQIISVLKVLTNENAWEWRYDAFISSFKINSRWAEPVWLRCLVHNVPCGTHNPGFESHRSLCTSASMWIKWLSCHTGHQEVSRCCIRGESEEYSACRQQCLQARDPPWLWNPGQMSLEDQNRGISGPTKQNNVLQKNFKKRFSAHLIPRNIIIEQFLPLGPFWGIQDSPFWGVESWIAAIVRFQAFHFGHFTKICDGNKESLTNSFPGNPVNL